eukprot:6472372-Amphidinium_carterae.1
MILDVHGHHCALCAKGPVRARHDTVKHAWDKLICQSVACHRRAVGFSCRYGCCVHEESRPGRARQVDAAMHLTSDTGIASCSVHQCRVTQVGERLNRIPWRCEVLPVSASLHWHAECFIL